MEQTDTDLLSEIVRHRDAEAFASLYRRHEAELFSLAMRITRNRERAEEALQEAMLRVWRAAGSFEGSASGVRAWLLQIVARASLSALRTGKRQETKKSRARARAEAGLEARAEPLPASSLEKKQLLTDLRRLLDELPELDRQVATLYFGGALSQREISNALAVPRRTIAYKLDETLKALRIALTQAGYSAMLPLLEERLSETICSGFAPPPELGPWVMGRVAASGHSPGPCSLAPEAPASAPPARVAGAAALAAGVLLCGAAWLVLAPSPQAAPSLPARRAEAPAPVEGPLQAIWDFTQGPAPDLKVLQGAWNWAATPSGGQMVVDPEVPLFVLLPMAFAKRPSRIKIKLYMDEGLSIGGACWVKGALLVPHRAWGFDESFPVPHPKRIDFEYTIYCFAQGIVAQRNGKTVGVKSYPQPEPGRQLALFFQRFKLQRIEIRSLELAAIPTPILDLQTQLQGLGNRGWYIDAHGQSSRMEAGE